MGTGRLVCMELRPEASAYRGAPKHHNVCPFPNVPRSFLHNKQAQLRGHSALIQF